jgi:uncharacterized protein (DUF2141 family)
MKIQIIGLWLLASGLWLYQPSGELSIKVSNISPVEGELYIAIYSDVDTYMDLEKTVFHRTVAIEHETELIVFENIPEGEYAVTVFQDLNGNGELDTRGFGIPEEPYGFSNDARGTFGPAKFRNAKFDLSGKMLINIKLVNDAKK